MSAVPELLDQAQAVPTTGRQRVIEVSDLSVSFANEQRTVHAVRHLGFHVDAGETLAIVGESGSGKSVSSLALMRLVEQGGGRLDSGSMWLTRRNGERLDLARASPSQMRSLRGAEGGYQLASSPQQIRVGSVLRAVEGPLAGVRGQRPEEIRYEGSATHLAELWVAVRAAVRGVLDEVTLAQVVSGELPSPVPELLTAPDAWRPR